jgi:hypothetical protein
VNERGILRCTYGNSYPTTGCTYTQVVLCHLVNELGVDGLEITLK